MNYKSVLIVDDSVTSRMIIKRCFKIAGFHNTEYYDSEDGLAAITFLNENTVDLIVTDLRMPKMDGSTFIKKLKKNVNTKDIPVIVISSMGSDTLEKELVNAGVKSVIKKPVSPAKVLKALES
jgi:two-component system chemotaxis response regulator CheY